MHNIYRTKQSEEKMRKIFAFLLIIIGIGCVAIPGVQLTNFPTAYNHNQVIVNSTDFAGEIFLNGKKIANISPWGEKSINLRTYYVNWYNSQEITFLVRMSVKNDVVSFKKSAWINNQRCYSDVFEITKQDIRMKLRRSH